MKSLVCTEPGTFAYVDIKKPAPKAGHAIIKIKRIGICGTDLHAYEGTQPYFSYPRILGHELSGELVSVDEGAGFEIGEAVTFIPYYSCGQCIACSMGKTNCCTTMQVCGVHVDGGMCEYLQVPTGALLHGQGLGYNELALVEPLAIGAHGIRRADVKPGEFVLVIGAGPIGLGAMEFARIAGAQVIALDMNEDRLQFCLDHMRVGHVVDAKRDDVAQKLSGITNGHMPTVVIDATGSQKAINKGFEYMAHGGKYVLIGLQKGEITFSHPAFHKREGTLMSSRNAILQDFEHVIAMLKKGLIKPTTYITHHVDFDFVKDVFGSWMDPKTGVIKAMVHL